MSILSVFTRKDLRERERTEQERFEHLEREADMRCSEQLPARLEALYHALVSHYEEANR